jgi:MOSC domain-containing protein YiiM
LQLLSLNIGRPHILVRHGRQYSTAINRRPVTGPLLLALAGLEGDRVSDDRVHGGPDKAVCCYPTEHYPYFTERLGVALTVPAFGENFTTAGLLEVAVCIGDTFRIGGAIVQITQPRQPCAKLAMKHDTPDLIRWINDTALTGFYLRVLHPGQLAAGQPFTLLDRAPHAPTVAAATRALRSNPPDRDALEHLRAAPALSAAWQRAVQRRLHPTDESDFEE